MKNESIKEEKPQITYAGILFNSTKFVCIIILLFVFLSCS